MLRILDVFVTRFHDTQEFSRRLNKQCATVTMQIYNYTILYYATIIITVCNYNRAGYSLNFFQK